MRWTEADQRCRMVPSNKRRLGLLGRSVNFSRYVAVSSEKRNQFGVGTFVTLLASGSIAFVLYLWLENSSITWRSNAAAQTAAPHWPRSASIVEKAVFCVLLFLAVSWPLNAICQNPRMLTKSLLEGRPRVSTVVVSTIWLAVVLALGLWILARA